MEVERIYRICLSRALQAFATTREQRRIGITLASEFRDSWAETSELKDCEFGITFVSIESACAVPTSCKFLRVIENRSAYEISFPEEPGRYRLLIDGTSKKGSVLLIPFESENFLVINTDDISKCDANRPLLAGHWKYGILGGDIPVQITVREEFGSTLGSHVWDSAVIFTRHLKRCIDCCGLEKRGLALELGAGCGLAGTALAYEGFEKVVLSDKACNIPFMLNTVTLNKKEHIVDVQSLDWSLNADIESFIGKYGTDIDMIVAADVLYDKAAALVLLDLLRKVVQQNKAKIIIGQKLRPFSDPESGLSRFDLMKILDFSAENILQEADVIIWKLERI